MSEKHINLQTEDGQVLTAEYKDGQLQIVEVSPSFEKSSSPTHILPEMNSEDSEHSEHKYIQVLDTGKGGLMQLDFLNFTLVKCNDDDNSYQVINTNDEDDQQNTYQVVGTSSDDESATITCVISGEDGDDGGDPDSFVVLDTEEGQDPLVILQSSLQQINSQTVHKNEGPVIKKPMTPTEILEKAKAIQRAKVLLNSQKKHKQTESNAVRKRQSKFPQPMELLSSPNFKLYLYSCKLCNFKCNAVKEMSAHKAREHSSSRSGGSGGGGRVHHQCPRCPFKANTHGQLTKHTHEVHTKKVSFNSLEVKAADVLVCGACGFESGNRDVFKKHIETTHGSSANC